MANNAFTPNPLQVLSAEAVGKIHTKALTGLVLTQAVRPVCLSEKGR